MASLYEGAGRLTPLFGGSRPGQASFGALSGLGDRLWRQLAGRKRNQNALSVLFKREVANGVAPSPRLAPLSPTPPSR